MKQEKDTILYSPKDTIINTDLRNKYMENMRTYSIFVLFDRAAPSIYDGLKSGQRRILYCMLNDIKCVSKATKRKSAATCGAVIGEYHPHSCLRGNTKVFLLNNSIVSIEELFNLGIKQFKSLGVNPNTFNPEPIVVHDLRIGQYTNKIYHIKFNNDAEIACTENHPFLLINGTYKMAKDLTLQDIPYTAYYNINTNNNIPLVYNYSKLCNESPFITNIWIEDVDNEPMYDFTVDTTNNMLFPIIGTNDNYIKFPMICLHNSDAIYDTQKKMSNWFECKAPLINYYGNSGSVQGETRFSA